MRRRIEAGVGERARDASRALGGVQLASPARPALPRRSRRPTCAATANHMDPGRRSASRAAAAASAFEVRPSMRAAAIDDRPFRPDEPQDRQPERRLARAGFADDADRLRPRARRATRRRPPSHERRCGAGSPCGSETRRADCQSLRRSLSRARSARRRLALGLGGEQHLACRDVADWRTRSSSCPPRRFFPAASPRHRRRCARTMPRSWVMNSIAMPSLACRSFSSARICACTVTSSAVVGSSAMSRSGRLASAMAIITRWRWPPESWCG